MSIVFHGDNNYGDHKDQHNDEVDNNVPRNGNCGDDVMMMVTVMKMMMMMKFLEMLLVRSMISCSMGLRPSIFIALCKSCQSSS